MTLPEHKAHLIRGLLPKLSALGRFQAKNCMASWLHRYDENFLIDHPRCKRLARLFSLPLLKEEGAGAKDHELLEVFDQRGGSFYLILQHPVDHAAFYLFCWDNFDDPASFPAEMVKAYMSRDLLLDSDL